MRLIRLRVHGQVFGERPVVGSRTLGNRSCSGQRPSRSEPNRLRMFIRLKMQLGKLDDREKRRKRRSVRMTRLTRRELLIGGTAIVAAGALPAAVLPPQTPQHQGLLMHRQRPGAHYLTTIKTKDRTTTYSKD